MVFATDNSIYRVPPQAVLFPRDTANVARVMRLLADERFRKVVQAGVVKDQLNAALVAQSLFFAPELSTSNRATVGGMISTDASGQGACLYGKTRDHVLKLTTVLTDGAVWNSGPLEDEALRAIQRRTDLVGAVHRAVDTIQREHAAEIEAGFPKLNRCLTGYDLAHIRDERGRFNLNSVICGSEGTLGVVTEATLNILPVPKHVALVNLRYASFDAALRDAGALMAFGAASVETVDSKVLALAQKDIVWESVRAFFPEDAERPTRGVLLLEFVGDTRAAVESSLGRLTAMLDAEGFDGRRLGYTVARGEAAVGAVWDMRKRAVGLLGSMAGERRPIPFVEDTAVPPERLADYIAEFRALLDGAGLDYGMFGHADAGVLHVSPAIDMKDAAQERLIREVSDGVAALTQRYGGLLWGEHGKGVRSEYSPRFFGPLYPLVQAVRAAFDPRNQLNPGKIATPPEGGDLLRVDGAPTRGAADRIIPEAVRAPYDTEMHCNGNGACFNWDADDTMCPSWKGTRERRHSPKGRAMLVREWLRRLSEAGVDPVAEAQALRASPPLRGFLGRLRNTLAQRRGEADFSHGVKEAMDGCLACKSCTGSCPIKLDVPGFRARFLELYHGRYLRPLRHHLVAGVERALPRAARFPRLYNAVVDSAPGRAALRALGLVDSPPISSIDLGAELAARGIALAAPGALRALPDAERDRSVILVQDAFTSLNETRLLLDVLDLMLALGARPWLAPFRPNGKPLHVHGFLGAFLRAAETNAAMLGKLASTGVPLVGIDPSMALTYRAEYRGAGVKVPAVLLLQEWLAQRKGEAPPAAARGPYRLLLHCTERTIAVASAREWRAAFARHGLALEVPPAGCCGMAGTYGHEAEHRPMSEHLYRLSWAALVETGGEVLATGYSCRSQVKRLDGTAPCHPAQALLAAIRESRDVARDPLPRAA
jgi:FAD/FMN-containing dehydrogenase/Fe-S oxidoreductase